MKLRNYSLTNGSYLIQFVHSDRTLSNSFFGPYSYNEVEETTLVTSYGSSKAPSVIEFNKTLPNFDYSQFVEGESIYTAEQLNYIFPKLSSSISTSLRITNLDTNEIYEKETAWELLGSL